MMIRFLWFWSTWSVPILISVSGQDVKGPGEFLDDVSFGVKEIEPYVNAQFNIEKLAEKYKLHDLPENEKNKTIQKLLNKPKVQKIIARCEEFHVLTDCDVSSYRRNDGTCNNLNHPKWGSAIIGQTRLLPAAYDGQFEFRKSVTGEDLPNVRNISIQLTSKNVPSLDVSALFPFIGQLIAHDVSLSPPTTMNGSSPDCCESSDHPQCRHPIVLDDDDPFYSKFNVTCLDFLRNAIYPSCTFEKRTPLNKKTSFLDLSPVYGNSDKENDFLRSDDGSGRLRTQEVKDGQLMPPNDKDSGFCLKEKPEICLLGGDERINQHTMLTSMHTIFLRLHNKLADIFRDINSHWNGDKVYEESRRLAVASYQYIVYKEFVPLVTKSDQITEYQINVNFDHGSLYDVTLNPSESVEFSTVALRMHSMVPKHISKFQPSLKMRKSYSNTKPVLKGKASSLVAGSCELPAQQNDGFIAKDVSGYLYKPHGAKYGFDIAATNIARGRDHGVPPYVVLVEYCLKIKIRNFEDLYQLMTFENVELLQGIYKDVRDIDPWVGVIMETAIEDCVVGPTASVIFANQFQKLKSGDSFFFTHTNSRNSFTEDQLQTIKNISMAKLMCETLKVKEVRRFPLRIPSEKNPLVSCRSLPKMNLSPWKEDL